MKRIFAILLISLSVSILLLHSFVPHHHSENEFNLEKILQKEPVKSPIDLLKVGFHLNLGANHLDNYQNNQSQIKNTVEKNQNSDRTNVISAALAIDFSHKENHKPLRFFDADKLIKTLFSISFSFRGPPHII